MKRDLWKELAQRARSEAAMENVAAPFGFEREVLRLAGERPTTIFASPWMPVLKPALVLAMGVMAICLAIQFNIDSGSAPSDLLVETDTLLTTALFVE